MTTELCPATFDGEHRHAATANPLVTRCPCGAELDDRPTPFVRDDDATRELYISESDIENARRAGEALRQLLGWEGVAFKGPTHPAHLEFTDGGTIVAVAKAIRRRSIRWGEERDYAFSEKRWYGIRGVIESRGVVGYLILTTRDGRRGYTPVEPWNIQYRARRGSRGVRSRGDSRDNEMMVHINWRAFKPIP